jgi:hypothetical protein
MAPAVHVSPQSSTASLGHAPEGVMLAEHGGNTTPQPQINLDHFVKIKATTQASRQANGK